MISTLFMAVYGVAMLALFVVAVTTLAWMLDSWRTPWAVGQMPFPVPDEPQLSFSLIVPARHEEAVLADTVARLLRQDHPALQVVLVVGDDDPGTTAVAALARGARPARRGRRRRQRAEEQAQGAEQGAAALHRARSSASSTPRTRSRSSCSPTSTRASVRPRARRAGRRPADELPVELVVAAQHPGVLLLVRQPPALPRRNGFIPLGGNTVFVRTDLLRAGRRLGRRLPRRGLRAGHPALESPARGSPCRTAPRSRPGRRRRPR